jgi:hypothetical protein
VREKRKGKTEEGDKEAGLHVCDFRLEIIITSDRRDNLSNVQSDGAFGNLCIGLFGLPMLQFLYSPHVKMKFGKQSVHPTFSG